MAGGGEVQVGKGAQQVPGQAAVALELPQPLGGPGLLQQGQLGAEDFELLGLLHPHAPHHSLHGAEQVHGHRHRGADHVLEQQRRAAHRQHPIGDGGELKVGIHRGADAPQLAATFEQL